MTAKEYLMQYRDAMRRTQAISDHLTELRAIAERTTPSYSTSGSGQPGDRLGAAVARMVEAEDRLEAEIELLIATEREVENVIKSVKDERLSLILYRRYILGEKWEQIAVALDLDYRWLLRLHGRALLAANDAIKLTIESHI